MSYPTSTLHIYEDAAGGWRWQLLARNGRIVADSAEAYGSHWKALRAVRTARATMLDAVIPEDHPSAATLRAKGIRDRRSSTATPTAQSAKVQETVPRADRRRST